MTIREIINEKLSHLKNSQDLQPGQAADILVELTALMGNINEEIKKRSDVYNKKLLELIEQPKMSVAKAQIIIRTLPEWGELETAKGYKETMLEAIRGLKYYLRAKAEEFGASGNM